MDKKKDELILLFFLMTTFRLTDKSECGHKTNAVVCRLSILIIPPVDTNEVYNLAN